MERAPASRRIAAWAVHGLTASGALWGLLAIAAIADGRFKQALGWNLLAVLIDAVDGSLARRARVREVLPEIDGPLLDNLVDYLNYVVVPAWLLHRAGLVPPGLEGPAAAAICLASAYQFSRRDAKTDDHFFTGFPSYWNLLVFYLLLTTPAPGFALGFVGLFVLLVFVPVRWLYPNRTTRFRGLTLGLTAVWALCLVWLLLEYPQAHPWVTYGSLLYVPYYVGMSLYLGRSA